jgi:hypothetical protein
MWSFIWNEDFEPVRTFFACTIEAKYRELVVPPKRQLSDKTAETAYAVKWQTRDITHFKEVAKAHEFKGVDGWCLKLNNASNVIELKGHM